MVRDMVLNKSDRVTYSNIITKKIKHNRLLKPEMIFNKELESVSKAGKETYKLSLNKEYWKDLRDTVPSLNVVFDEAHILFNARNSMRKQNKIMGDFLAMIRRIVGQSEDGYGELVFITHLPRRIDVIAREMANVIYYHVCHYELHCKKCKYIHYENNEVPEKIKLCINCNSNVIKKNHTIEVFKFNSVNNYEQWKTYGRSTYYDRVEILDIEKYFSYYDTLQWDDLLSSDF